MAADIVDVVDAGLSSTHRTAGGRSAEAKVGLHSCDGWARRYSRLCVSCSVVCAPPHNAVAPAAAEARPAGVRLAVYAGREREVRCLMQATVATSSTVGPSRTCPLP